MSVIYAATLAENIQLVFFMRVCPVCRLFADIGLKPRTDIRALTYPATQTLSRLFVRQAFAA